MSLLELFVIAVGLSMDAFAVAVCKGLAMRRVGLAGALVVGLYFGAFQAAMPLAGYAIGARVSGRLLAFNNWAAFALLTLIGVNMIRGSFGGAEGGAGAASLRVAVMLPLALATSIDALAVGVSFAFLNVRVGPAVAFIGLVTLALSMLGVKAGSVFGARYKAGAERAGGALLVLMGLKILLERVISV